VSFDDWLLALHLLSAAAFVSGVVVFWVIIVAARSMDSPGETLRLGPLSLLAEATLGTGALGTIVLGIWLALSLGGYEFWDGWIIGAIVLWVIAMALGQRTNAAYAPAVAKAQELQAAGQTGPSAELLALNRTSTGIVMQSLASLVVLLILIDMISKPGA
jgi:predicted integral membrane protein DUF2269